MLAFEAVPVMLPQTEQEKLRLDMLNLITGGRYMLGVMTADDFQRREFPPNDLAERAVSNLNAAMKRVRSGDLPWLECH